MNGSSLFYRWDGRPDGPVLVLSHSLGVSHAMRDLQIAALGEPFRILRHDLRGHGDSGLLETRGKIDDFGRQMRGFVRRFPKAPRKNLLLEKRGFPDIGNRAAKVLSHLGDTFMGGCGLE